MSSIILGGSANGQVFYLSQTTVTTVAQVSDFSIFNPATVCFNPIDPPTVYLVIPELDSGGITRFLSTGVNRGHVLATSSQVSQRTYRRDSGDSILVGNIFNRELTVLLYDSSGSLLVLSPGTLYSVKINLR